MGFPSREQNEREQVASWLETVAEQIRLGNLVGLKVDWKQGSGQLDAVITPAKALDYIKLDLTIEPENS